jgi:hypothetical protein
LETWPCRERQRNGLLFKPWDRRREAQFLPQRIGHEFHEAADVSLRAEPHQMSIPPDRGSPADAVSVPILGIGVGEDRFLRDGGDEAQAQQRRRFPFRDDRALGQGRDRHPADGLVMEQPPVRLVPIPVAQIAAIARPVAADGGDMVAGGAGPRIEEGSQAIPGCEFEFEQASAFLKPCPLLRSESGQRNRRLPGVCPL